MKLQEALLILGFSNVNVLPKVKDIQRRFYKLSKIKHPDKNGGSKESTEEFQTLLNAYNLAGKAAEKVKPEDDDVDDIIARKIFKQFQVSSVKVNSQSITIKTEKHLNSIWMEILTTDVGQPTGNQPTHGKKFTMEDKCEDTHSNIFITLYHTGNLLVQAEGNKQSLNIHFLKCHLEGLYTQLYNRAKLQGKLSRPSHSAKTPLRKLVNPRRSMKQRITCPKCEFETDATSKIAKHIKKIHESTIARTLSMIEELDASEIDNSHPITRKFHRTFCGKGFDNDKDLSIHEEEHKEKCNQCESVFYSENDLTSHKEANHNNPTPPSKSEQPTIKPTFLELPTLPTKRKLEIECEYCPYITNKAMEFMMHQKTHNTNFHCQKCSFTSSSEFAFEMHMQDNHTQEQHLTCISCTVCGMVFADQEDLKGHAKRTHKIINETNLNVLTENIQEEKEVHKCEKCTFTSTEEIVFRQHILVSHTPGFECHKCKALIKPDDLAVGCTSCDLFFHKKCTNLAASQESAWKPTTWRCHKCISNDTESVNKS